MAAVDMVDAVVATLHVILIVVGGLEVTCGTGVGQLVHIHADAQWSQATLIDHDVNRLRPTGYRGVVASLIGATVATRRGSERERSDRNGGGEGAALLCDDLHFRVSLVVEFVAVVWAVRAHGADGEVALITIRDSSA